MSDTSQAEAQQGKANQFPCPQCGADTKFKAGAEALVCEHCGATVAIAGGAPVVEHPLAEGMAKAAKGSLVAQGREIQCKTCGARAITAGAATRCAFCDSTLVVELTTNDAAFLPEAVLPFVVDRKAAEEDWKKWITSRWFAPGDLASRAKRDGLDGCYRPYWTYDSDTWTSYTGERGEYYYTRETYKDSEGKTQTREVRHTRWYNCSGTVTVDFDDVLVPATTSLPRSLVEKLEPWNLTQLKPFDPRYLAGYLAERYSLDIEPGFEIAKERMEPRILSDIRSDIGGDEQRIHFHRTSYRNTTFKHILLPLWISSYRYNEKVYRTIVNAQSGDVAGERPYSWIKIALFTLFIAALIAAGVFAYYHYKHT